MIAASCLMMLLADLSLAFLSFETAFHIVGVNACSSGTAEAVSSLGWRLRDAALLLLLLPLLLLLLLLLLDVVRRRCFFGC
jgi:hypothetical protein